MAAMDDKLAHGMVSEAIRKIRRENDNHTKEISKLFRETTKIYRKNGAAGYFSAMCLKMPDKLPEETLINCSVLRSKFSRNRTFQTLSIAINPVRYITGSGNENTEDCLGINNYIVEITPTRVRAGVELVPIVLIRHALKRLLENGGMSDLNLTALANITKRASVFSYLQKICQNEMGTSSDVVIPVGDLFNPRGVLLGRISPLRFERKSVQNPEQKDGVVMATYVPIGDLPEWRIRTMREFGDFASRFTEDDMNEFIIQITSNLVIEQDIIERFIPVQESLTASFTSWSRMAGANVDEFEISTPAC